MFAASILLALGPLSVLAQQFNSTRGCPKIHVFAARETTVPASDPYGSAITVTDLILNAYLGISTSEAIIYPACGGQAECGNISYADSVIQGISSVAHQVNAFNRKCPKSLLVLHGYSQGGQIFDDAYCGGGDTNEGFNFTGIPIGEPALRRIKAGIFMGDPRWIKGLSFEVGTCPAQGFAPRPAGFHCPFAENIQSYCDAPDPFCCNGDNATVHQGYGQEYGAVALKFVQEKLDAALRHDHF